MKDDSAPALPTGTLMQGRRGLIMGVANDRSIAWAIARACAAQGAELAFTYQGEALEKRVRPLAASVGSDFVVPCDVASDEDMDAAFGAVEERWGKLDFFVHAVGFADKQYLRGRFVDTPREAFLQALTLAHPIALTDRVPSASRRQANCYYSSSDAAFADRYEARAHYGRALAGEVALDGGWRIYSSGPGIALGLVIGSLLGLRLQHEALVVDPAMPAVLDGLTVQLQLADMRFELTYRVGPRGHGV
eukprot:gene47642-58368_t